MRFNTDYKNLNNEVFEKMQLMVLLLSFSDNDTSLNTLGEVYELLADLFDEKQIFYNHIAGYSYALLKDENLVIEIRLDNDETPDEIQISVRLSAEKIMFFDYFINNPCGFVSEVNAYAKRIDEEIMGG